MKSKYRMLINNTVLHVSFFCCYAAFFLLLSFYFDNISTSQSARGEGSIAMAVFVLMFSITHAMLLIGWGTIHKFFSERRIPLIQHFIVALIIFVLGVMVCGIIVPIWGKPSTYGVCVIPGAISPKPEDFNNHYLPMSPRPYADFYSQ